MLMKVEGMNSSNINFDSWGLLTIEQGLRSSLKK